MIKNTTHSITLLIAVLLVLLLVAACANPEPGEARGTPEPGETPGAIGQAPGNESGSLPPADPDTGKLTESNATPGALPETGSGGDTMPLPPDVTATVSTTVAVTGTSTVTGPGDSTFPTITGIVTGTTATVADDATRIQVKLDEYSIEMIDSTPAGPTIFDIMNTGNWEHGFVLEGNGIRATMSRSIQPDELGEIRLVLPPGTYRVYCPVDGYADLGMALELTVTP